MKELEDLHRLFARAGRPSVASSRRLKELQQNCISRKDPDSFYVTVNVAQGFTFPWGHNLESALGQKVESLEGLMELIHPTWKEVHKAYAKALLRLIAFKRNGPLNDEIVFSTEIPLRVSSGGYRWFKQTTTAGEASEDGNLISYLSQYYVVGSFSSLIPDFPVITLRGKSGKWVNQAFRHSVSVLFPDILEKNFSQAHQKIIFAYREHSTWNGHGWEVPIKAEMAAKLGMSTGALTRAIPRLLSQARTVFPAHAASNITNFVNLMNTLFPQSLVTSGNE